MLQQQDHFSADPNVLYTQLGDEEGVLLHLHTQHYYSLNETGLIIWKGVTKGLSLGEVASLLQEEYDIDEEGAWQNVQEFVLHLQKKKLVVAASE